MYSGPVRHTPELERVRTLPWREIDLAAAADLAERWSPLLLNDAGRAQWSRLAALPAIAREAELARFARPAELGGEGCPLRLRPLQALALYEARAAQGLFASLGVGEGKTLITWLLALVLGAVRPVLVVPAGLVRDTHDKFAALAKYWCAPKRSPLVISYEKLGAPSSAPLLCNCGKCMGEEEPLVAGGYRPDLLMADESDKLRNPNAACTRRVARYMSRHSSTIYAGFTGTAWRKSLRNSAPQLIWALKWGAPVPISWVELEEWCESLDLRDGEPRRAPGALVLLDSAGPHVVDDDERAATAFRRRLLATPGVLQSEGQSCDQPLTIRLIKAPDDPILDAAFTQFRETEATLDGWPIEDPLTYRKHATELGCGFYYVWDPRPPREWLDARRAAAAFVREKIKESARRGKPLDSSAPVYREFPHAPELVRWKEIEPTFVPNTVPRPITATVFGYVNAWLKANGPALVWVQHTYVGDVLAGMCGVPYFGPGGLDARGRYIMDHSPQESAIVSLRANARGRNLQLWNSNLVVGPPQAATDWEQAICGRTHRQGQEHPVHIEVLISCAENLYSVQKAHAEAGWVRSRGGSVGRLLVARYDWSVFPMAELADLPVEHPAKARWTLPGKSIFGDATGV